MKNYRDSVTLYLIELQLRKIIINYEKINIKECEVRKLVNPY